MLGNFLSAVSIAISFALAALSAAWGGGHEVAVLWLWGAAALFLLLGVGGLIWPLLRRSHVRSGPRPDMRIDQAIDYIINDSTAKLKHPGAPFRIESGPASGQLVSVAGIEHEDARQRLHEKLRFGDIQAW
jgi:hypothetical protein